MATRCRLTLFNSGKTREFDLVIGADGIRSKIRQLAFSDSPIHYLDLYTAYFSIPYSESDGRWARSYNIPGRRTILLRPDNQGKTRVFLLFRSSQRGYDELDANAQKDLLQKLFVDAGFEAARVLSGLKNTDDFYFEAIGLVKMNQWSQGRIALLGDAGYCASPVSGMGTSLGLAGAYVLANELGRHQSHTDAFRKYEALMRPYVTYAQRIAPETLRFGLPQTRTGIALKNAVISFAARPTILRLIEKMAGTKAVNEIPLPDYEAVLG